MIINSPIGKLKIQDNGKAITEICIVDDHTDDTGSSTLQEKCAIQLNEFFFGKRTVFDLPVDPAGTNFQKSVWNALLEIPFGDTMTYGEVAKSIGNHKAARAVGGACNKNPVLIVIPCHRIVGANGRLIGFACGLDVKSKLLDIEKNEVSDV